MWHIAVCVVASRMIYVLEGGGVAIQQRAAWAALPAPSIAVASSAAQRAQIRCICARDARDAAGAAPASPVRAAAVTGTAGWLCPLHPRWGRGGVPRPLRNGT